MFGVAKKIDLGKKIIYKQKSSMRYFFFRIRTRNLSNVQLIFKYLFKNPYKSFTISNYISFQ